METSASELGGAKQQARLAARVGALLHALDVARSTHGRRAATNLARARQLLRGFIKTVQQKIHGPVAGRLLADALPAKSELAPLKPSRALSPRA